MFSRNVELALELGLELPSQETEEFLLLDTMAPQPALATVTMCAMRNIRLVVALRFMLKQTRLLTQLATEYQLTEPTCIRLTSLVMDVLSSSSTQVSNESST